MALDTSDEGLNRRIDALRSGFEGRATGLRTRNETYLRLFSPEFSDRLLEHDQWAEDFRAKDEGHVRSSFNFVAAVVELWTALEAYPFPNITWTEEYLPSPPPDLDETKYQQTIQTHRALKLLSRQEATMREQVLDKMHRLGRLPRHYYRATMRKNLYGHSYLKVMPNERIKRFEYTSGYDPSTVYPVWDAFDERNLAAILVVTRKRARTMAEHYPDAVRIEDDTSVGFNSWYNPTGGNKGTQEDRSWVWVEDYWVLDRDWSKEIADGEPLRSRVFCALRVNGKLVETREYPGWTSVPFFQFENDNLRDRFGRSDAGTVAPIQDGVNKFLSQQQDVIAGESRPKFIHQTDGGGRVELDDEGVITIPTDENLAQLAVHLDSFPTQVHGSQLMEYLARITGLNDSVWGRIVASQNSGRALATAWRSVASRLVPRLQANEETLDQIFRHELDLMELYDWHGAQDIYNGNRDYTIEFPNQEPRDFMEVAQVAINKMNAGLIDIMGAMDETGERSPDEMLERVRADYVDTVMHPEKAQSFLLLDREKQQMALEAAAAQQQLAAQQQQQDAQQQAATTPPGGAPGGANGGPNPAAYAASAQARTQAAQQAAPTGASGVPGPATQAGQPANATQVSTLVQDGGPARNRIIQKY